jgi:hypothetical protein
LPGYEKNINDLKKIITEDRNGDGKIDINDLKLIYKDIYALISITSIFVLTVSEINETEILNLCLYSFFAHSSTSFSQSEKEKKEENEDEDEKKIILQIMGAVYDLFMTSTKIKKLLESLENCSCSCSFLSKAGKNVTKKIDKMTVDEKKNLEHIIKVNRSESFQSEHQN